MSEKSGTNNVFATYSGTRFSGYYFFLQGAAILGWWVWLFLFPESRQLFLGASAPDRELFAFLLPDLSVTAVTSLVASLLFFRELSWFVPIAWLSAGSIVYAALYTVSWAAAGQGSWLGVAFMLPAALFAVIAALDASPEVAPVLRRARPRTTRRHVLETLGQISLFWSFFLVVVPLLLVALETKLGWHFHGQMPSQKAIAVLLFLAFSVLGFASGITMSKHGAGTPLPFDSTNRLVIAGPYGFVRNPMVVAGLGQGTAVAIWLNSWIVTAYVVVGGLIWQLLVRPAEERDLLSKFGDGYRRYCREVRCWFPRFSSYSARPNVTNQGEGIQS